MKFKALLIILIIIVTNCSSRTEKSNRIINGRKAFIQEFPYQVSIEATFVHICGGSIIHPKVILTAAHCMAHLIGKTSVDPSELRVRAGTSVAERGGKIYEVEKVVPHEDYDNDAWVDLHDIGLVFLKKAIKKSMTTKPIQLAFEQAKPGQHALVTGYGDRLIKESRMALPTRQLMAVELTIVETKPCEEKILMHGQLVADGMICAQGQGRKDACQGDSGGPLAIDNVLYAVTSWGIGCGKKNLPGVYTDLSYYADWLKENYLKVVNCIDNTQKRDKTSACSTHYNVTETDLA